MVDKNLTYTATHLYVCTLVFQTLRLNDSSTKRKHPHLDSTPESHLGREFRQLNVW